MATIKSNVYSLKNNKKTQYLYTKGFEFSLNGENYIGEYHINGTSVSTGPTPSNRSQKLTKYYSNPDLYAYDKARGFKVRYRTPPNQIVFSPTEPDYNVGYAMRHFIERSKNFLSYPLEIDSNQAKAYGKSGGIDEVAYTLVSFKWKLTGFERTKIINAATIVEGIYEHNVREVVLASKHIPNLIDAIKNYTEYARITLV